MEANYVHKDSTTLIQDKLVKNELNQIELQYNALKQRKFNELLKENQELKKQIETLEKTNNQLISKLDRYDAIVDERDELKKQLEVGEEQYNDLVEEKEKLQEQLSVKSLQLEEIKLSKRDYTQENILEMKLILKENQQKEFIEYLENMIKELDYDDVDDEETKGYILQRRDTFKEILLKFKEIIGDKDE